MSFIFYFSPDRHRIFKDVYLEEIPHYKIQTKFPGYFDWYAVEDQEKIKIFRRSSELYFDVNYQKGMNDYDYYELFYSSMNLDRCLLRESCYSLINEFYKENYDNKMTFYVDKKEIKHGWQVDNFYKDIDKKQGWAKLKWGE